MCWELDEGRRQPRPTDPLIHSRCGLSQQRVDPRTPHKWRRARSMGWYLLFSFIVRNKKYDHLPSLPAPSSLHIPAGPFRVALSPSFSHSFPDSGLQRCSRHPPPVSLP
jgi:hypothetical protein